MLKYGIKKEMLQFTRTKRLLGVILAMFGFGIANPMLYKLMDVILQFANSGIDTASQTHLMFGAASYTQSGAEIDAVFGMFTNASSIFSMCISDLCGTSLLIIMLVLMSPCGGEQKKRATIIPSCSGLNNMDYIIPKYIVYPVTVFAGAFLCAIMEGTLCNLMFEDSKIDLGILFMTSLFVAIYLTFLIVIYMSIGIMTSHPGIATVSIYIGQTLLQIILQSMELTQYNPFTLFFVISGMLYGGDNVFADNAASIIVGIVISLVVMALMFFLTYTVLNAKRINNQEDRPEF